MSKKKITSNDVAKQAGVSQSAVSRVYTPGASVSKKTADKVHKAAEELGYRPNVLARSLITGSSRIIGVVVSYLENYFYPDALEKLSTALQAEGYHALIFMAPQTAENIDQVVQEILDYQVDGIVLASVSMSSELASRCQAAGVPVVLFNRTQSDPRLASVTSDNFGGGQRVAEFFIAGGHERIAYIAGWESASTQRDREAGFRAALDNSQLALHARGVGNYKYDEAAEAAKRIFDVDNPPDAVFVGNDHMAFAVIDVLRFGLGIDVPGEVSVVGFDDVPLAAWPAYDLTTVRQCANKMVRETVVAVLQSVTEAVQPRQVVTEAPLVIRSSARVPEGWEQ